MSPRRILVAGYYGFGNAGDEAILSSVLVSLRALEPDLEAIVVSGDPEATAIAHGVEAISWRNPEAQQAAAARADLVLLGGGGLFHDHWGFDSDTVLTGSPSGLAHYAGPALLAALEGKPLFLYGVGVGPLSSEAGRELTRAIALLAAGITVRDTESLRSLVGLGVPPERVIVTADPAFGFAFPTPEPAPESAFRLAIALRHWDREVEPDAWEREVASGIGLFLANHDGAEAVFVPFQRHAGDLENDATVAGRVRSLLPEPERSRIAEPSDPAQAAALLASADVVLAMRLHAAIFAMRSAVPLVALSYDPKVAQMVDTLEAPVPVLPLQGLTGARVAECLEQAVASREEYVRTLRETLPAAVERERENARRALALLRHPNSGASPEPAAVKAILRHAPGRARLESAASARAAQVSGAGDHAGSLAREGLTEQPDRPYDLVVLSIIDWDFRFQRPQQLALQFARHGHRVFYLALSEFLPPGSGPFALKEKAPGVRELKVRSRRRLDPFTGALDADDFAVLEEVFEEFSRQQGVHRAVCMVQLPFWAPLAERLAERLGWTIVYDCMDDWTTFPGFGPAVLGLEQGLVRRADLTLVSAERLRRKWASDARRLLLLRNGIDLSHYQARFGPSPLLEAVPRPILGYFGAIAQWVDVPLLEKIAERFTAASVVLAGGVFDVDLSGVASRPNVRLLGQQPYGEMPRLLYHFDVCLIPFQINPVTEATNPVKFYEYSFSGAPVVAPDLPELRIHAELCYLAADHASFLERLESALAEPADDARRLARRRVAASNDWEERYRAADAAIRAAEAGRWLAISRERLGAHRRREADLEERAQSLTRELNQEKRLGESLRLQFATARNELRAIHTSRYWRTADLYWRARRRLAAWLDRPKRPPVPSAPAAAPIEETAEIAAARAGVAENPRHDVLCLPIIDWDFRFQRPQQLMSRFAAQGHRVFYVAQKFRAAGPPFTLARKAENVWEVSLRGPALNVYKEFLGAEAAEALFVALDALRREVSLGATAVVIQLPFWWPLARRARQQFAWPVVYDCMDLHSGFSTNRPGMVAAEEELLTAANLVVASSQVLWERAREKNERTLLLPNACDYDHFSEIGPARNARPLVGYYGAIADWFDADLVANLAEKRTDWDFLLVGSTYAGDTHRLARLANVRMPGEIPYAELPGTLARFDVALIPFRRLPLTEATSPVKAYEILAAGKPLVSVPLPEVAALAPLVRLASDAAGFEREIEAALSETDPTAAERRRAFARENTWERRYAELAPAVRGAFPRASIVVVTYNNRELNRLCLESLAARTEWPNSEIVVVDNASHDGSVEDLREAERSRPNLRLIANSENRGFAAANNQGLAIATGEYLVLLNNDTVVTRSWLAALIRHLAAEPRLGMVGPSTNAIANEAKVDVGYGDIAELPAWAARFARENDGQVFAIPMLAMFCLAMKRTVFEQVGPLDERFGIGMFEDDDYNRRVRDAGWEIRCARDAFVHHWQKASFRLLGEEQYLALFEENRKKYEAKWGEAWKAEGVDVWKRPDLGFYQDQLEAVRARVAGSRGLVLFLPSVGWGIHLFQRPHHLARTFAREGYVAVFDSSNAHDDVNGFKEIEPNLFLYRGPDGVLQELADPVLWAFPYNYHARAGYPSSARVVYDWIDDLSVFPYERELLERNHADALAEATVVASVAARLHAIALAARPDAIYLANGVEYEHFAGGDAPIPQDRELAAFRASGRPIAGYYGALAAWFDYDLLDELARLKPDWNFLLIGPMYDQSLRGQPMLKRSNVVWLGPRDYRLLPGYLRLFDVATIPFRINEITLATSPLKLYEYFAGGKPTVTTPMPECQAYPEVEIARDAREFADALERARQKGQDSDFVGRLRELARENSWAARTRTVREALGKARPLSNRPARAVSLPRETPSPTRTAGQQPAASDIPAQFRRMSFLTGRCNVCGRQTRFFYGDPLLHRESLTCEHCLTTSRYRSIARGLLRSLRTLAGVEAASLTDLAATTSDRKLSIYDTQVPFAYEGNAYPIPDLLAACAWLTVACSKFDPKVRRGKRLAERTTNQDLEALTFPDASFDVVVTSDVMEHVRLDGRAHREIRRVLKPGGIYLFTVPHFRDQPTLVRVEVVDPDHPERDRYLTEREYHGDANADEGRALSYRSYGTDLDGALEALGFDVEYSREDLPELGILNTELFFCRVRSEG